MRVKIVDIGGITLEDVKIPKSVVVSMHDFAKAHACDYALRDFVYIRNDGSEAAKELFANSALELDGDDILIIEVEETCDTGVYA